MQDARNEGLIFAANMASTFLHDPTYICNHICSTEHQVMRLKDKMGDRANASSEVEYRGAWGQLVGEQGE